MIHTVGKNSTGWPSRAKAPPIGPTDKRLSRHCPSALATRSMAAAVGAVGLPFHRNCCCHFDHTAAHARPSSYFETLRPFRSAAMRVGLASRGMTGGCTRIERALMDCCCRATSKYFSILSPNELWKILCASDILAPMDGALSFRVSLWPVMLDALVAGCLPAYANSAKAFVGEVEFLGISRH